jgi:hypothetical protein
MVTDTHSDTNTVFYYLTAVAGASAYGVVQDRTSM